MSLGPFATQERSQWVQEMLVVARHDFGHHDMPWKRRALMALDAAGVEGERLTPMEIESTVAPFVGYVADRAERSQMVAIGMKAGILSKTDKIQIR